MCIRDRYTPATLAAEELEPESVQTVAVRTRKCTNCSGEFYIQKIHFEKMASWKTYILFTIIILLFEYEDKQGRYRPKTTIALNPQEPFGQEGMSEEYKVKVGNRIEPVIFEPQRKIKLSRSTYKVTSYVDFKPYKQSFKRFRYYIGKFIHDLHDPQYVSTLYNTERQAGDSVINRSPGAETYFT